MTETMAVIRVEIKGGVAIILLNRAKAMNSFNEEMLAQLLKELESLDANPAVRAIVLHGSQKFFSAGMDLKYLSEAKSPASGGKDFLDRLENLLIEKHGATTVHRYAKPTFAKPAPDEVIDRILRDQCQGVIEALAD